MRNGYWWVEALLGLLLIGTPFFWFTDFRAVAYADVILGILVIVWALVGYQLIGGANPRDIRPTRA